MVSTGNQSSSCLKSSQSGGEIGTVMFTGITDLSVPLPHSRPPGSPGVCKFSKSLRCFDIKPELGQTADN